MRVVMLTWSYWPGPEGGAERQCRKVVERIAGKGVESIVLTSRIGGEEILGKDDSKGQIVRLGRFVPYENMLKSRCVCLFNRISNKMKCAPRTEHLMRSILFWLLLPVVYGSRLMFILALRSWFANNSAKVDVIHVHESDWLAGVAAWIGNRYRIPVLAKTATIPALPRIGYDVPFRRLWHRYRMNCFFIAQHDGLRDDLISQGVSREQVFLLANGVEIPERSASPAQPGPVLYVGNFSQGPHWKAFDVLIKAWSLVHHTFPGAQLHMVGGGDVSQWKRLADKLGCGGAIRFLGMLEDPSEQYERSCIFVLPSRVEGISNALLEAQSYGLPCVVSDIPGNLAVVEDGFNGLVVPVGDARALAKAINLLMNDPDLRVKIGIAARERAGRDFSIDSTVDRLLAVYKTVNAVG